MFPYFRIFCLILLQIKGLTGEDSRLTCPLIWTSYEVGNSIPDAAIPVQDSIEELGRQLVARVLVGKEYYVGRFEPQLGMAYFPSPTGENGTALRQTEFELLINPHGCRVAWTLIDVKFRVEVTQGTTSSGYVGRGKVPEDYFNIFPDWIWYGGQIKGSLITLPIDDSTEIISSSSNYQYLVAYSSGVLIEIQDFRFPEGLPPLQTELASKEETYNDSPATITQSLAFSKTIRETLTIKVTKVHISRTTVSMRFDVIVYGKKTTETQEYRREETTTTTTETETNVTTILDFTVPPFSSVSTCSVIEMVEKVKLKYEATGVYKAPGKTALEILSIVKDVPNAVILDDRVIVPIEGEFEASVVMNSHFIIVPEGDQDDCVPGAKKYYN